MKFSALTPLLNVVDVAASLAWYRHLGFQERVRVEQDGVLAWAQASNDDHDLMFSRSATSAPPSRFDRPSHADVVLCLTVDDAHAAQARIAAAGLAPGPMARQSYGVDGFLLRDPDGYEIAVVSRPLQLA